MVVIYAILTGFFLTIPFLNKYVLKTVNLEEVKREARNHVDSISILKDEGQYSLMREYCQRVDSSYGERKDAPSQFLAQFAAFSSAQSHILASEWEEAVDAFELMLDRYPTTVFAEQIFFMSGEALMQAEEFRRAIDWFERLERNRTVAQEFPKYRRANLKAGKYVNLDELNQKQEETGRFYTNEQRKAEANNLDKEAGGNLFSDAVVKIGECYLKLGASDSARTQFELIEQYFPDSDRLDDMQKFIADTYFNDGLKFKEEAAGMAESDQKALMSERSMHQFQRAEREYQKFLNRYAESDLASKVYIQLAATRFEMGQDEGAEKVFRDAIRNLKVIEKQAEVQLEIGNYYNRTDKYDKAADAYGKVVQNYPETDFAGRAQFLLAVMHENSGDTLQAMQGFRMVVENYRSSEVFPEAAFRLATKHLNRKEFDQAEKYMNDIVRLRPNDPVAAKSWFQMGLMSQERKDWLEAIRRFEFAIGVGITTISDQASLKIADCWEALGDKQAAEKARGKIQDETLRDELYWEDEGGKQVPTKKLEQIRQKLLVKRSAKDRSFWFEKLAEVYAEMGKLDSAILSIDSAKANTKSRLKSTGLSMRKADYLASNELKRYQEARNLLQELQDGRGLSAAQRAKILFDFNDIYRKEKANEKAIDGFKEFVTTYAGSEDDKERTMATIALYHVGHLYQQIEQWDSALVHYEKFLELFPESQQLVDVIVFIGEVKLKQQAGEKAIDYMQELRGKFKDQVFIQEGKQRLDYQVAEMYSSRLAKESGKEEYYRKAIAFYGKALDGDSTTLFYSAAAFGLGLTYGRMGEALGNREEFAAQAEEAFALVKQDHTSYYKAAKNEHAKLLAKRDWKAAVASLSEAVEQSYKDYQSFKAKEEFQAADRALRETVIATLAVGSIYEEQDMHQEAVETFARIYDEYPAADSNLVAAALIQSVSALNNGKRYKEMHELAGRMKVQFPTSSFTGNALYLKAASFLILGQKNPSQFRKGYDAFNEVIAFLEAKKELSESEQTLLEVSYYQKADCQFYAKQYRPAVDLYEASIKKFPQGKYRCISIFQQGNALWSMEAYEQAGEKYEKVQKTCASDSNFGHYCMNMKQYAFSLEKTQQAKAASSVYKKCVASCAKDAKVQEMCHEGTQRLLINN